MPERSQIHQWRGQSRLKLVFQLLLTLTFQANLLDWTASTTDVNSGTGRYGSCCNEMDVWEANSMAAAYTPHPCTVTGPTRCSDADCSSGYCDPAGCDFNPYRMGNKTYYGKGLTIDTTRKITVVTQFITADGTATGALSEIRRMYVQNGQVIQNSKTNIPGMAPYDSITEQFCTDQKLAFEDENIFGAKGGLTNMGAAFERGMVLVMSIWDDHAANMLWLDSNYPVSGNPTKPGVARGSCSTGGAMPADLEVIGTFSSVTFSNIKFGDIGSTYSATGSATTTSSAASVCLTLYERLLSSHESFLDKSLGCCSLCPGTLLLFIPQALVRGNLTCYQ